MNGIAKRKVNDLVLDFILNMILLIGVISLFNLARYLLKIRKLIKLCKDNPNVQGISIVNGEVKVIEKESKMPEEQEIPMVIDEICGKAVKKEEAYRMVIEGKEHYFCSWECREAYINRQKEGE